MREVVDEFANPALSAPVTLLFDDSQVRLTPRRATRAALGTEPRDGVLVPTLDRDRLAELVDERISSNAAPVDATVPDRRRRAPGRPLATRS